jgi:hypothetical protein
LLKLGRNKPLLFHPADLLSINKKVIKKPKKPIYEKTKKTIDFLVNSSYSI